MGSANERIRYFVTSFPIDRNHTQDDHSRVTTVTNVNNRSQKTQKDILYLTITTSDGIYVVVSLKKIHW